MREPSESQKREAERLCTDLINTSQSLIPSSTTLVLRALVLIIKRLYDLAS